MTLREAVVEIEAEVALLDLSARSELERAKGSAKARRTSQARYLDRKRLALETLLAEVRAKAHTGGPEVTAAEVAEAHPGDTGGVHPESAEAPSGDDAEAAKAPPPWPDEILDVADLLTPVREAWDRLRTGAAARYGGYEPLSATSLPISETLSAEGLAYHAERGRDSTDMVLLAVLRLGMEQGVRVKRYDNKDAAELVLRWIERAAAAQSVDASWVLRAVRRLL